MTRYIYIYNSIRSFATSNTARRVKFFEKTEGLKMKRNIPFSPPDISELEINEVAEALRSGWIKILSVS